MSANSAYLLPTYAEDLFSDEDILDPYGHYQRIRDLGPVVDYPRYECAIVARHGDVRHVLRDAVSFISGKGVFLSREMNENRAATILTSDSQRHEFLPKIEGEPLSPAAMKELKDRIFAEADRLIARLYANHQSFDAVKELAQVLPLTVVTDLIGLAQEGRENMLSWAAAGFQLAGPFNARAQAALPAVSELVAYAFEKMDPVDVKPGSLAARVFGLANRGVITHEVARGMIVDLIGPSLDTTILGTGAVLMLLAQHRSQWQDLKSDPSLIPNAINEALRLESPVRGFSRYVTRDSIIDGASIAQGSRVLLLYGSANRDERYWNEPERFDIRRVNSAGHMAFGAGPHSCLGAHLARLEMHAVVEALRTRVEYFEIGEPVFVLNNTLRGLASLPMTLH